MLVRSIVVRRMALAVVVLVAPSLARASPRARVTPDPPVVAGARPTASVCSGNKIRCYAHVQTTASGEIRASATREGLSPADLQSAYRIDPNITSTPTIAIVDAYGYPELESDLATYRAEFGLPPCTVENGCLRIINQDGATSPLPADPPPDDDWTIETALDVDMASAACPKCKILVVQANDPSINMYIAQNAAAAAGPTVISDSWGAPEEVGADLSNLEAFLDHPGIAQFVAAGDNGFNDGGRGPDYPSTSAHVIAVGGTALVSAANSRGWSETAWTLGGSSCSLSIAKPAFQTTSPCAFRATNEIAAVADPRTGVAVFNSRNGGWLVEGGTSAAAPIVAAIFAATGRGNATAAQIANSATMLFDVTSGSNGDCGNVLCNAGVGWDGPTGYGTPNAALLKEGGGSPGPLEVKITSPADNATVMPGFKVTATVSPTAVIVGIAIDDTVLSVATAGPYEFATPPTLAAGRSSLERISQPTSGCDRRIAHRVRLGAYGRFSLVISGKENPRSASGRAP
jgi:subtilase family serine protease